jgi:hypothetical protein
VGLGRRLLLLPALGLLLGAGAASAQIVSMPHSQVLECMTPAAGDRGTPFYDPELVRRKDGGTVKVELVFSEPDAEPGVRLLTPTAFRSLTESVRAHVRRFRLPCQKSGAEPARVVLEYLFRPDDGRSVVAMPAVDPVQAERARLSQCLTRISGKERPDYPEAANRRDIQGNLLVRMRFTSPTEPPTHQHLAEPVHDLLKAEVDEFMPGYRLPCHAGGPTEFDVLFTFRIEGGERLVLRDLPLRSLLGLARTVQRPARFDTSTMGCPFELRVTHFQPFKPHLVDQVGQALPERQEFANWLSRIELKFDQATALAVLGDSFTVSVPCVRLDL